MDDKDLIIKRLQEQHRVLEKQEKILTVRIADLEHRLGLKLLELSVKTMDCLFLNKN